MTEKEAIYILRNAAWLGSDADRQKVEEAVEVVANAIEAQDMTLYMNLPEVSAEEVVEILKRNNRIELIPSGEDTNVPNTDTISRQATITEIKNYERDSTAPIDYVKIVEQMPPAQPDARYINANELIKRLQQAGLDDAVSIAVKMAGHERLKHVPSAQPDLIAKIQNGINATNANDSYSCGMRNGMRWCMSLVDGKEPLFENCPSVQPEREKGKWIPCSERLPEKYGNYLVTTDDGEVDIGSCDPENKDRQDHFWSGCDADGFFWYGENIVIAWMPLPKSYMRGKQDEID